MLIHNRFLFSPQKEGFCCSPPALRQNFAGNTSAVPGAMNIEKYGKDVGRAAGFISGSANKQILGLPGCASSRLSAALQPGFGKAFSHSAKRH